MEQKCEFKHYGRWFEVYNDKGCFGGYMPIQWDVESIKQLYLIEEENDGWLEDWKKAQRQGNREKGEMEIKKIQLMKKIDQSLLESINEDFRNLFNKFMRVFKRENK